MSASSLAICLAITLFAAGAYALGATAHHYPKWQTTGQFLWIAFAAILVYNIGRIWLAAFGVTW